MGNKALLIITILILGGLLVFGWLGMRTEKEATYNPKSAEVESIPDPNLLDNDEAIQDDPERVIITPDKPIEDISEALENTKAIGPNEGYLDILVVHDETGIPVSGAELSLDPQTEDLEDKKNFYKALELTGWGELHKLTENIVIRGMGKKENTDSFGRTSARIPAGIPIKLVVTGAGFVPCRLAVPALLPGERRKVIVTVDRLTFYGRVVENTSAQQPMAGIKVLTEHTESSYIVTDSAGLFSVKLESADFILPKLIIKVEDYGPVWVKVTKGHERIERALLIKLDRAATVYGQVIGPTGPVAAASLSFSTDAYQICQGDDFIHGEEVEWQTKTDNSGTYRMEGLPPNAELNVKVSLMGKEDPVLLLGHLRLLPGEETRADWQLDGLARIHGKVLDQYSKPVSGVDVVAMEPESGFLQETKREETPVFVREDYEEIYRISKTNQSGSFILSNISPGCVLVGVYPESKKSFAISGNQEPEDPSEKLDDVSATGMIIKIPEGTFEKEVILRVHRGLYIRGHVLNPAGNPIDDALVFATHETYSGFLMARWEERDRFEIGPLVPGKYKLKATSHSSSDSECVEVYAGTENVVLQLSLGGVIHGRIIGESGLNLYNAYVSVTHRERILEKGCSISSEGDFRIKGLVHGVYDLHVHLGEQWVGYYIGAKVTPGGESEEILLQLEPASNLVIRLKGANQFHLCSIEYRGGILTTGGIAVGKPWSVVVPGGHFRIVLSRMVLENATYLKEIDSKEVEIKVGERKDIVFDI